MSLKKRLSGRHFIHRIPVPQESKSNIVKRTCKVCSVAERENDRRLGCPKQKRTGRETSYQCEQCKVALCVDKCFKICHTQKDYIKYYTRHILRD